MVRRPAAVLSARRGRSVPAGAAVLALSALALAYLLIAPVLPASHSDGLRLDAAVGAGFVLAAVAALVPSATAWPLALLLLLGTALLAGAVDAAGAHAAASLPEAFAWAAAGLLFARVFAPAALAIGVPLLIGVLDAAGLTGTTTVLHEAATRGDALTLELPAWGGGQAVSLPSLVAGVLGALAFWTAAHDLRRPWTLVLVVEAIVLATVVSLPVIACGVALYLLVNGDRLLEALRREG